MSRPPLSISQSSAIAFFLLAGFIIFITIRGELSQYLAAVGLGAAAKAKG
ncbi:MAG: hypothetical protein KGL39_44405 [Patescibacteria group bacterium]|nr:hypothetical protein [Patescibacteria group bacterium]